MGQTTEIRRPLLSYFGAILVLLLAGLFGISLVRTIRLLVSWYSALPLMDYWRVPQDLSSYYALHLAAFWNQHNEHRIVFPEMIYAADMLLLHGRLILPLIVSALCYFGVWCILAWGVYSCKNLPFPLRETAVLFAGALMFWQGCAVVLATPFQLSFTLMQLAVAAAFVFLAKLHETRRSVFVAWLVAVAVVATYSSAGGMVVWPILVAGALLLKIDRRQVVVMALGGGVAVGVFFIGYRSMGNLRVLPLFQHPLYLLGFVASYFSMPFGSATNAAGTLVGWRVGLFSLVAFGGCLAIAIRKREWRSRLGILVFGNYFYMLAAVLTTAAGRMDPNDAFFITAKAPRYVTVPMAAWGTLIVAAIWLLPKTRLRWLTLPAAFLAAVLACYGCLKQHEFVEKAAQDFADLQISTLMLRNNVEDTPIILTIFPDAGFVKFYLPVLREKRLSVFAHGPDRWLGQSLESLHPFARPVPGDITRVYPVEGGLEIYGWSDSPFIADEHAILFVDQNGKIAGYGRRPSAGFPLNFGTWNTPPALAFVGFVKLSPSIQSLSTYVWQRPGKTLHRMGEPIAIPNVTPASTSGAPLAGVTWETNNGFRLNGQIVSAENGQPPPGPIYGSAGEGSAGEHKTSELRSNVFAAPSNHCLVLPVLHGLSAYGQSVEVIDATTRQVIATAPMFDGRSLWERWRISLPQNASQIFVSVRDSGEDGTQWVAVTAPDACP